MEGLTGLSKVTKGAMGKTGNWREMKPVIDYEKCTKCLRCWVSCPEGCISRAEDNRVEIDYEYCKGCGVCENECRPKAIKMIKEW
jgi:pyruvate ferredoxin oxidoreductase delta subunit